MRNLGSSPTTALLGNFAIFSGRDGCNALFTALQCRWLFSVVAASCTTSLQSFSVHRPFHILQSSPDTHRSLATCFPTSHSCQYANHTLFSSAMGKSRSATVVIAYLMREHNISPSEALSHLRQARSICEPNEGFMDQLELYGKMQTPEDVEATPAYQRWVYQREIELSRACGQAPEADKIRFEDEHVTDQTSSFELRCRKCRWVEPRRMLLMSCSTLLPPLVMPSAYKLIGDHWQHHNICSRTSRPHP